MKLYDEHSNYISPTKDTEDRPMQLPTIGVILPIESNLFMKTHQILPIVQEGSENIKPLKINQNRS